MLILKALIITISHSLILFSEMYNSMINQYNQAEENLKIISQKVEFQDDWFKRYQSSPSQSNKNRKIVKFNTIGTQSQFIRHTKYSSNNEEEREKYSKEKVITKKSSLAQISFPMIGNSKDGQENAYFWEQRLKCRETRNLTNHFHSRQSKNNKITDLIQNELNKINNNAYADIYEHIRFKSLAIQYPFSKDNKIAGLQMQPLKKNESTPKPNQIKVKIRRESKIFQKNREIITKVDKKLTLDKLFKSTYRTKQ